MAECASRNGNSGKVRGMGEWERVFQELAERYLLGTRAKECKNMLDMHIGMTNRTKAKICTLLIITAALITTETKKND